jgi:hypothetical protein
LSVFLKSLIDRCFLMADFKEYLKEVVAGHIRKGSLKNGNKGV